MKRGVVLVTATLATAMAIASACSFPDPILTDEPPTTTPEAGTSDAPIGKESGATEAGGEAGLVDNVFAIDGNQNVDPDGASQEASVAPDAKPLDASGCMDPCDCDKDMERSNDAASCNPTGRDCNDLDPFIPYDDGFVASKPNGHNGDWNCDGVVTKQFLVNISCGLLTDCAAQGFKTDPPCGATGEYVFCKPAVVILGGAVCVEDRTEGRAQGCR